tara:strand:+ start:775 stop:2349 length:1575 start_codon:yes stop_codon:yes gene_type:complete
MRGRGIGSYRLGDKYVSPDRKLSELLMQESARKGPAYHWSDTLGRIAQGLTGGYLAGRDRKNQNAANEAFTKVEADSFTRQPMISEEQARGSNQVGAILDQYNDQNVMEGPMVQENVRRIGKQQDTITQAEDRIKEANNPGTVYNNPADRDKRIEFENNSIANANDMIDQYGDRFNDQMAIGKGDRDIFVDKEIARQREASEQNVLDKKMPQLDYSMQNLRGLENNPYAQRLLQGLMMQSADRDYAAGLAKTQRGYDQEDATLKHTRGVETKQLPFTNEQMEQQKKIYDYKQKPRTVTTAEGVFIQNPDGSLGDRIGSPHSQYFDPKQYEQKEKIKADVKGDAYSKKPMPASALKVQDDHIAAINTSKGLDADLGKWDEMITSGKLDLGFFANPINAAKTYTGFGGDEQSRNYSSFKTSLEKMRNESLRLNKGIQTEGDAQRIWNELISNINDEEFVSQRLKELQKTNQRAVEIRKYQIDSIRNNYGKGPLDEAPEPKAIPGGGKTDFVYIPGQGVVPEKRGQK